MNNRRIALIGGSGFIGRHLTAELSNLGHRCRIISRHPHRHREPRTVAEVVAADPFNPTELTDVLHGQDTVVHLVGILNEQGAHRSFQRVHVELVEQVVAACHAAKVGRLLHMSALNADAHRGASQYLRSKGEGESRAHELAKPEIAVTSFRPSVVFGPDDSFINRFAALLDLPGPLPLACPEARLSPVYVGDVARAFARALDDRATFGKRLDLCGPKTYSLIELVRLVAQTTGRRAWILGLPDWASRLQANMLQYVPGKPFTPDNYLSLGTPSECDRNGLDALGITPVSLENATAQFCLGKPRTRLLDGLRRDSGR